MSVQLGVLDRADGSARFSFGESTRLGCAATQSVDAYSALGSTSALASAAGPTEVRLREELPTEATFEILHRPLTGTPSTPSRALEQSLRALLSPLINLSQHPRSLLQLVVQSLTPDAPDYPPNNLDADDEPRPRREWPPEGYEEDTSESGGSKVAPRAGLSMGSRAVAVNAAMLALLHAGSIGLKGVAVAVSLAYVQRGEGCELVLDPTDAEESKATSRHVFAWAFGDVGRPVSGDTQGGGMEVDGEDAQGGGPAGEELVWAESEGSFSQPDVSLCDWLNPG